MGRGDIEEEKEEATPRVIFLHAASRAQVSVISCF
jgi:hypothetical protein